MSQKPINFLRMYRKRSPLTQGDIAFLMGLTDYTNISRCEKGQRVPNVELLLVYHFLFNTSIEAFFERQSRIVREGLINRIESLTNNLKLQEGNPKNTSRVKFLGEVITRLIN